MSMTTTAAIAAGMNGALSIRKTIPGIIGALSVISRSRLKSLMPLEFRGNILSVLEIEQFQYHCQDMEKFLSLYIRCDEDKAIADNVVVEAENGVWPVYDLRVGGSYRFAVAGVYGTEKVWRILEFQITPPSHTHENGLYYDDELNPHEFCIYCHPRTDEQAKKDAENLSRFLIRDRAVESAVELDDQASLLLASYQKRNEDWYRQVLAYAYKTVTFQWGDVVRKAVPGSETVDEVRKQSVQSAVASALYSTGKYIPENEDNLAQQEFETALMELAFGKDGFVDGTLKVAGGVENNISTYVEVRDQLGKIDFKAISQMNKTQKMNYQGITSSGVKEMFVDGKTGNPKAGFTLACLEYAIDCGIDIGQYINWSDDQRELFYTTLSQAHTNIEFLNELKDTYPDDKVLVEYCEDTIEGIERELNPSFFTWVCNAGETAGDVMYILGKNAVDTGTDFVVPAAIGTAFGMAGAVVTFVGAGGGLITEWTMGTDSTIDLHEDIDILYTNIEQRALDYQDVKNDGSVSEAAKRFQEFNLLNMKMAGLDMVGQLNQGKLKNETNAMKKNYEKYRSNLLEN